MERDKALFKFACVSFGVSAFAWLLSPFGNYRGNALAVFFAVLVGVLFWLGLLAGIVLIMMINSHRKKSAGARAKLSGRPGAFRFFSNRRAMIADIAMIVFLVVLIIMSFVSNKAQSMFMVVFAFFLFSIYMHCVLNGTNYQYIMSKKTRSVRNER